MRVLFISKSLHAVSGAGVGSRMHLNALKRLVGEENVYVVDVGLSEAAHREEKYIAYGKYRNILDRLHRHLEGNTYLFSNKIISDVCKIIKKEKVSFVFVDDSYYGNLVKTIKKECDAVTVVTFFHDVKAALFRIWMKTAPWFDKIDFRIGLAQEKISTMYTDANIVLNQNENSLLVDDAERVLTDKNADLDDFGRMLDHTWRLKRQTGSAVSTNSIDELYAKGVAAGALGGKLLGAGGGGFLVFYVQPERQDSVRWAMRDLMHIPFAFEDGGTRVIHYTPETYIPKE